MPRITFDSLQFDDIIVEIAGTDYRVPGDVPIPSVMAIDKAARALLADPEETTDAQVLELYNLLLNLFQVRQPDMTELPVGPRALIPVALAVCNPEQFMKPEDEPDPTGPQPPAGTKPKSNTPRKPKKQKTATSSS